MKNPVISTILMLMLAGCANSERNRTAQALEQLKTASAACAARYSEAPKDAIERAKCLNAADAAFQPFIRYPDLIGLRMAKRTQLAERQASGKISRAQAELEFAELRTALATEWQRRVNSDRSVAAQQQAAWAATSAAISADAPRTCSSVGNVTTCY